MPIAIWLAALAIAASLPIAWWALSGDRVEGRTARANLSTGVNVITDLRQAALQQSATERVVNPTMAAVARRARWFTPAGMLERLERQVFLAGIADQWPSDRLLAVKGMLTISLGTLGFLAFMVDPTVLRFVAFLMLTAMGFFAVDYVMDVKARRRQGEIARQLSDVLDQITICVEAGLGFESAMARVATNVGALPDEIGRTLQDIQIGVPRDQALDNLLNRTDVDDLRIFVHAFIQAERYGIPIAQVLRVQSAEMRDKRKMAAEERAMKMPVKIVMPVVLCILPALFVVVAGPAVVRISQTSFGG